MLSHYDCLVSSYRTIVKSSFLAIFCVLRDGADYLVIGRPILKPPASISSRKAAAAIIRTEIEELKKVAHHDAR